MLVASLLLVADEPVADGPGKAVLGALTAGADTRASEGGPAAAAGTADLEAAAALIKLWLKSGLNSIAAWSVKTVKT